MANLTVRERLLALAFVSLCLGSDSAFAQPEGTPEERGDSVATTEAHAEEAPAAAHDKGEGDLWDKVSIGTLWYLASGYGEEDGSKFSETAIRRGYVTFKFKQSKWFEPRVTFDTHMSDEGDWMIRLKYMYGKLKIPIETGLITEPNVEFGLVHGPWFDYEEHIDSYRAQGTMFIERQGILNSADAGFTVGGLFGRKLSKDYQKRVSKSYPGQYGSFALGVYNGGGYHAEEQNQNKVFESRISLRPGGDALPNLQLSHFLVYGKGNANPAPDWMLNAGMLSFEHEYLVLTGQAVFGKGNQKGTALDEYGEAAEYWGVSGFVEGKLPQQKSSVIGRYDRITWDAAGGELATSRLIFGYAYHFLPHNFALLDFDYVTYEEEGVQDDWQVKLTMQVHYP